MLDDSLEIRMNAKVQRQRSAVNDSVPRSSARPATAVQPDEQFSPPHAEDRPSPAEQPRRVDPLWMITAAGAALFVFLLGAVTFS
jgi:hypothetical protein